MNTDSDLEYFNSFSDKELDELPRREKFRANIDTWDLNRSDYPWKRAGRWLESKVGVNLDIVVSEFVKLPWIPKKYRTYHQLATYHVETKTFVGKDGFVYFNDRFGNRPTMVINFYSNFLYVDPVTNILRFHKRQKRVNYKLLWEQKEAKTCRILGDYHQLLKLFGIWYEVKGFPLDKTVKPNTRLIDENGYIAKSLYGFNHCAWWNVQITYKKQLNRAELKKYGLTNDPIHSVKKCPKCGGYHCLIHA